MAVRSARNPRRLATTTVETAVVISAFLMLFFSIFEYARFVMTVEAVENAAREGARYAVVHTLDKELADIEAEIRYRMAGIDQRLDNWNIAISAKIMRADQPGEVPGTALPNWNDASPADGIIVEITGEYRPVLPNLLRMNSSIPLRARSVMYCEGN